MRDNEEIAADIFRSVLVPGFRLPRILVLRLPLPNSPMICSRHVHACDGLI